VISMRARRDLSFAGRRVHLPFKILVSRFYNM
jgi:hypothetical protein